MKFKLTIIFIIALVLYSCGNTESSNPADEIINKTIEVSGGQKFSVSTIEFDFRDRHYKAIRNKGMFHYERAFNDSIGAFKDVLTNSDYARFLNNEPFNVHDTMAVKYARSVNSVHYFSVLPYGLNDEAVNKTFIEKLMIKGEVYNKIKVTFNENGGGEDYEDVFVYYVNTKTNKIDYLSYIYFVDGGGIRFREAYNERYVNGLRFVDYNNYKSESEDVDLLALDQLFEKDELILLSKIELENITVQ